MLGLRFVRPSQFPRRAPLPSTFLTVALVIAVAMVSALIPDPAVANHLKAANAWISIPEPYENPSAYLLIQNHDSEVHTIVGGSCPGCDWIEIRRVTFKDGVMGSEKLDQMDVPAKGAVAFVPRGLFLSLVGLGSVESGAKIPLTLDLKNGEKLEIEAVVRQP